LGASHRSASVTDIPLRRA